MSRLIALLGEYSPAFKPHAATMAAFDHSRSFLGVHADAEWVSTEHLDARLFNRFSGIWVAPGSPYKNLEKTLRAIQYARENAIPCLGTCGGFQHMVIEYARNVLGHIDAQHAEYDPYASPLFITSLTCSLKGRQMRLHFVPGSKAAEIYGSCSATEHYYCDFGVNPDYVSGLKQGPMRISGADAEGEVRVIEHPEHPFFLGTLYVPQMRSTRERPHPLVTAFLASACDVDPHPFEVPNRS